MAVQEETPLAAHLLLIRLLMGLFVELLALATILLCPCSYREHLLNAVTIILSIPEQRFFFQLIINVSDCI